MNKTKIFKPYHPGEMLKETLSELGVSQYRFSKITVIPQAAA